MAKREKECKITAVAPPDDHLVDVLCVASYYDLKLKHNVLYGDCFAVSETRAKELSEKGFVRVL